MINAVEYDVNAKLLPEHRFVIAARVMPHTTESRSLIMTAHY